MRQSGVLLCVMVLAVPAKSPTVLAGGLFDELVPLSAMGFPEPVQLTGLFGESTNTGSKESFTALLAPEPTLFSTQLPRV